MRENSTTASIIAVAGAGKKKFWNTCKSLTTKNQFAILYLYKNGKQKKSDNSKSQIELVNDIKSILNKDYYLYTSTVSSESNKYVLVDNLKENSIGTFNVKTKKYTEMVVFYEQIVNIEAF